MDEVPRARHGDIRRCRSPCEGGRPRGHDRDFQRARNLRAACARRRGVERRCHAVARHPWFLVLLDKRTADDRREGTGSRRREMRELTRTKTIAAALASLCVVAVPALARAADTSAPVTFSKDVAPIFQRNCQVCHRPGTVAPMSLVTYDEARPWARSIRQRVAQREMPPWHIDKTQGIQHYKNDRSLSDTEIATIVKWVDAGA